MDEIDESRRIDSNGGQTISPWKVITVIVPMISICISVLAGNLLVILAINTQKTLRTMSNFYIMSLAVVDLLVGILILPLAIAKVILGKWVLGTALCHFWVTADVTLCTVSILHLCAIALDRYRCVTDGVSYMQGRSKVSIGSTVVGIWLVAFWISFPPLLGWNNWDTIGGNSSKCDLSAEPGYVIHSAIGSLLFPLIIMVVLYVRIYEAIQDRLAERQKLDVMADYSTDGDLSSETSERRSLNDPPPTKSKISVQSEQIRIIVENKMRVSLSRERKAAKTLGIIMAAFLGCWLPFGLMYALTPFLPVIFHPSPTLVDILTWFGYFNSALNPIIYTIFSLDFRKGFKQLLGIPI